MIKIKNIKEKINLKIRENPINYSILIGNNLMPNLNKIISENYSGRKVFLVTDKNVNKLYGDKIIANLEKKYEVTSYILPPGEKAKSFKYLKQGYDILVKNNFQRDDLVIGFGGGVPGDLAGYLAASYMRGVPLIQIPTSLLAQVDSSVGGKTAINHEFGKNLIGAFYQPQRVIIDVNLLNTLPLRELKTGMAEVIKYGLIADKRFFEFLFKNKEKIYNLENEYIIEVIKTSCNIKAEIVMEDQKEKGIRAILNYGHTIAHALEAQYEYDKYTHGEAVAIGMKGSAILSNQLGYLSENDLKKIKKILSLYELPDKIEVEKVENIYHKMKYDKKAKNDILRWILLKNIGKSFVEKGIKKEIIFEILEELK